MRCTYMRSMCHAGTDACKHGIVLPLACNALCASAVNVLAYMRAQAGAVVPLLSLCVGPDGPLPPLAPDVIETAVAAALGDNLARSLPSSGRFALGAADPVAEASAEGGPCASCAGRAGRRCHQH